MYGDAQAANGPSSRLHSKLVPPPNVNGGALAGGAWCPAALVSTANVRVAGDVVDGADGVLRAHLKVWAPSLSAAVV